MDVKSYWNPSNEMWDDAAAVVYYLPFCRWNWRKVKVHSCDFNRVTSYYGQSKIFNWRTYAGR